MRARNARDGRKRRPRRARCCRRVVRNRDRIAAARMRRLSVRLVVGGRRLNVESKCSRRICGRVRRGWWRRYAANAAKMRSLACRIIGDMNVGCLLLQIGGKWIERLISVLKALFLSILSPTHTHC